MTHPQVNSASGNDERRINGSKDINANHSILLTFEGIKFIFKIQFSRRSQYTDFYFKRT